MNKLEEDFNYCKEHDEFFSFETVDEWRAWLIEAGCLSEEE